MTTEDGAGDPTVRPRPAALTIAIALVVALVGAVLTAALASWLSPNTGRFSGVVYLFVLTGVAVTLGDVLSGLPRALALVAGLLLGALAVHLHWAVWTHGQLAARTLVPGAVEEVPSSAEERRDDPSRPPDPSPPPRACAWLAADAPSPGLVEVLTRPAEVIDYMGAFAEVGYEHQSRTGVLLHTAGGQLWFFWTVEALLLGLLPAVLGAGRFLERAPAA